MEYIPQPGEMSDNAYLDLLPNNDDVQDYPDLPEHHALNNNCETLATIEKKKRELMSAMA